MGLATVQALANYIGGYVEPTEMAIFACPSRAMARQAKRSETEFPQARTVTPGVHNTQQQKRRCQ